MVPSLPSRSGGAWLLAAEEQQEPAIGAHAVAADRSKISAVKVGPPLIADGTPNRLEKPHGVPVEVAPSLVVDERGVHQERVEQSRRAAPDALDHGAFHQHGDARRQKLADGLAFHLALRYFCFMKASISATVRGRPGVRFSQPVSVMTMVSSTRTPRFSPGQTA
jgi:hypothetical protein